MAAVPDSRPGHHEFQQLAMRTLESKQQRAEGTTLLAKLPAFISDLANPQASYYLPTPGVGAVYPNSEVSSEVKAPTVDSSSLSQTLGSDYNLHVEMLKFSAPQMYSVQPLPNKAPCDLAQELRVCVPFRCCWTTDSIIPDNWLC